jgi:hypothetical protein
MVTDVPISTSYVLGVVVDEYVEKQRCVTLRHQGPASVVPRRLVWAASRPQGTIVTQAAGRAFTRLPREVAHLRRRQYNRAAGTGVPGGLDQRNIASMPHFFFGRRL